MNKAIDTSDTIARNSFGPGEFRGAVGDLGTTLPLAFMLVVSFVLLPLSGSLSTLLFLVPIPILGVLLLFDSWQMIALTRRLIRANQILVALSVGIVSFATHNLFIALTIGFVIEKTLDFWSLEIPLPGWIARLTVRERNS